jgi:hypothetical protein
MNQEIKGKINYGVWGVICGAVIVAAYGFIWAGWTTGKSKQLMVDEAIAKSRINTQAEICIAQFIQDPKYKEKLAELKKFEYLERTGFIEKGGWDKMPGQKEALSGVAQACAFGLEDLLKK